MTRVGKIDGQKNVVAVAVDQSRNVSPAPAHVPDAVYANPFQRQKTNLPWPVRGGNIENTHPGAPAAEIAARYRLADGAGVIDFFIGKADVGK
ncbi:hypothetical protein D3C71_1378110 [compost metagenome]